MFVESVLTAAIFRYKNISKIPEYTEQSKLPTCTEKKSKKVSQALDRVQNRLSAWAHNQLHISILIHKIAHPILYMQTRASFRIEHEYIMRELRFKIGKRLDRVTSKKERRKKGATRKSAGVDRVYPRWPKSLGLRDILACPEARAKYRIIRTMCHDSRCAQHGCNNTCAVSTSRNEFLNFVLNFSSREISKQQSTSKCNEK